MMKAAAIYLGIILAITGVITGLPMAIWSDDSKESVAATPTTAEKPEVVAEAPAVVVPKADPVVVSAAAEVAPAEAPEEASSTMTALLAAVQPTSAEVPERAAQAPLPKPIVRGGSVGLEQTTAAILTELAIVDEVPEVAAKDVELKAMSDLALNGLRALQGISPEAAAPPTLETLVAQALREGQNDDYINALVNEAAGTGQISVPSALVTSDGRVDTAVLLNSLVAQAKIAQGTTAAVDPNSVIAGGQGVEVYALSTASGGGESHRFYTVLPGDSLGAISVKFYGDVTFFTRIYDANRAILASPDRLNVGQRLVIPAI